MKKLFYYLVIWWIMTKNSFLIMLSQRSILLIFLIGKILRFSIFFGFVYFLFKGTNNLAGYNLNQTLFLFLTFNFIDNTSQFLFRGVYEFKGQVVSRKFDLALIKPVSPLLGSLMGGADVIDLATIPPLIFAMFYVGANLDPHPLSIVTYFFLLINAILIATAFHIFILAFGIITLEFDHMIMIYRDLVSLGRFPVDIYREPLRVFLTYLMPVAIMISLPAKSLMGLASLEAILGSFLVGILSIFVSLKFWKYALKFYTSASN